MDTLENVEENFVLYENLGKSNFGIINVNFSFADNDITIGLNKSFDDLISNPEIDLLKEKVENKILNKDEAIKIVRDNFIAQINYIAFRDNTLSVLLSPEEKDKIMPKLSGVIKKNRENTILYYERGNKKYRKFRFFRSL